MTKETKIERIERERQEQIKRHEGVSNVLEDCIAGIGRAQWWIDNLLVGPLDPRVRKILEVNQDTIHASWTLIHAARDAHNALAEDETMLGKMW